MERANFPERGNFYKKSDTGEIWYYREFFHQHNPDPVKMIILVRKQDMLKKPEDREQLQVKYTDFGNHFEEVKNHD